ncbi:MAG: T9SS type A sorting domain-containing protein, partial [Bacteroidota bacterium]
EIIQLSPADSLLRLDFQQGGFNLGRIVIKETKTGIDDQQSSDEVKIYPVPVEEFLHFSSFKAIQKIEIFSLTGKAVYNNIFEEAKKQCRINLRHLSSGIYLAKIRFSDNLTYTTKIIKN